ncbi:MAG: hypothetical protein ACYTFM_11390 [Planctomycetota bacterium]
MSEDRQNETMLVAAARRGDREALRQLFERNWFTTICNIELE